ncbi:MAG TPA: hybrid sensor histidine kinase/response regulator [Steroidobacter sp.]|nr:hybrid sensor histidine kinase/response regulator [Steroidobacteraceae bacterium]HLS81785.1 hybrid sensor histidine kinase/response regulator [Steroidobacter sp.]
MESDQNKNAERNGAPGWEECGAADSACEHDAPESTDAAPTPGVDANLTDARAAAEAVRKLASRLQLFTREREELLAAERAARNEAERAIRQTDEFLATLAHELRTPLANVLNWAHVLLEKFADVDELLKKGLSVIADNTTAQSRLISDLLDVSRIGSGKVVLELKPVDFPELIAAAVTAQRPTAEAHRVSLSVELEGEFAVGLADPVRLQQVLWNLIANAIKFTPPGGRVVVRGVCTASHCEVSVSDSGEGFAPEFAPHMFDRFTQAAGVRSRRVGLGLGLSLVKQLVEMHGGHVEARSDGVGKGAVFLVRLPLKHVDTHAPMDITGSWKVDPEAMQPGSLGGLRVLAVDDQPSMLDYLARTLQEYGAQVLAVRSGEHALQALQQAGDDGFDVLLSDIGMPGIDGYELIRAVRETRKIPPERLTAIAVTAFAREADRAHILACGFQAHIAKPIETAQLVTALRELTKKRLAVGG